MENIYAFFSSVKKLIFGNSTPAQLSAIPVQDPSSNIPAASPSAINHFEHTAPITQNQLNMQTFTSFISSNSQKAIRVLVLTTAVVFSVFNGAKAQLSGSNYTFAASSGTFTPIVGGTSVITAGGGTAAAFLADGVLSDSLELGFTFRFMGNAYTKVRASSDGYLTFNLTATNSSTNNLSTGTARPLVAPLWDDLDGGTTLTGSDAPSASYKTEGTAGSRVFTIEWINWQWNWNATGKTISFQVKLYEATGAIQFIYRPEGGTISSPTASVGFAGATSASPNFLSLSDLVASPTVSSTTETTTIASLPASGQTYTFTPSSTVPNDPTNMTFTSVGKTGMTVNWTDASNEAFYLLTRATDASFTQGVVTTTYASNITTTGALTGLVPNTTYYFKLQSVSEFTISSGLTGSQATTAGANITSQATGNWSALATWAGGVVPTIGDNVTIADGHTVTIDNTSATCANLTVGQGTSGILQYTSTSGTLTVGGNVTVSAGATFTGGTSTSSTKILHIGGGFGTSPAAGGLSAGNLTVNGTFNMAPLTGVNVTANFYGVDNGAISGSGGSCQFATIVVNKGTNLNSILDVTRVITFGNALTAAGTKLTITAGTFKLSSASTLVAYHSGQTICAAAGRLWLNNSGASISSLNAGSTSTSTGGGAPTITGVLKIDAGTFSYGVGNNTATFSSTTGALEMSGGTFNMFGAVSFSSSTGTRFQMSGGNIIVDASRNTSNLGSTTTMFSIGTSTTVNWTGGNIQILDPHVAAGTNLAFSLSSGGTKVMTGGALILGSDTATLALTAANNSGFGVTIGAPINELIIKNQAATYPARMVKVNANSFVRKLTVNSGGYLFLGTATTPYTFTVTDTLVNEGTIAGTEPGGSQTIGTLQLGSKNPAVGGVKVSGTAGLFSRIGTLSIYDTVGVTLNQTNNINTNRINMFQGNLVNAGKVTLGLGTTNSTIQFGGSGYAGNSIASGNFDAAPNFNLGSYKLTVRYDQEGVNNSIGAEIPSSRNVNFIVMNNTNGVTAAGGPVNVTDTITFTAGNLTTSSSNPLNVTGTTEGAVQGGSSASYVVGPMTRVIPSNLSTSSRYHLPVGKVRYNGMFLTNPLTNAGGSATVAAEVFDAATGGTPTGLSGALKTNRYWAASVTDGAANVDSIGIITLRDSTFGADMIAGSTTLTGAYDIVGGTVTLFGADSVRTGRRSQTLPGFFVFANKAAAEPSNLVVTPSGNQCINVARSVSVLVTPGGAAVDSVVLVYTLNGGAQNRIQMTNSTGNGLLLADTWTATIPTVTPVNATVAWSVITYDQNSLTKSLAGTTYADEPNLTTTAVAAASPATLCVGQSTTLTVSPVSSGSVTVGTGSLTGSSVAQTVFAGGWGGYKSQWIIRASELTALGLSAGNITALSFEPTTSGEAYEGFYVHVGSTTATTTTATFIDVATLTQVYRGTGTDNSYTPVANTVNNLAFGAGTGSSSSFNWDGTSNLVVSFSWSQVPAAATATASTMKYYAPGYQCGTYKQADNLTPENMLGQTSGTATSSRPIFGFTGNKAPAATAISWSDGTNVVGTTSPLSVVVNNTTTYTATITVNNCPVVSNSVTVTANPLPAAPVGTDNDQCGAGTPDCSVAGAGTNEVYRWYLVATDGTALAGQSGATLSNYSISITTTFYVALFNNTTQCEGPRTAVTQTVIQPDAINASGPASICIGGDASLSVVNAVVPPNYSYTYTWRAINVANSGLPTPLNGSTLTVTPEAAGTYNYEVQGIAGICSVLDTVSVLVNSLPVISSTTASPATICAGETSSLSVFSPAFTDGPQSLPTTGYVAPPAVSNATADEDLGNVTISQGATVILNNTSAANLLVGTIGTATGSAGSYSNFTAFGPYALNAGQTYNFSLTSITAGGNFGNAMAIYIDYNRDGDFVDAGETVYSATSTISGPHTETGSFVVPSTASAGWTRMRVLCHEGVPTGPTQSVSYGEWEEYAINIRGISLNTALNYSWNPGAISGATASVNPATTTTYTATVTDPATTCTNTSTVEVTVNPLPASPVATNSTQCGAAVPTPSVTSGGLTVSPVFNWYSSASAPASNRTQFSSNFSTATLNGITLSGSATVVDAFSSPIGYLTLTPSVANSLGGATIPANGVNANRYRVAFTSITGAGIVNNAADGFSYSFGDSLSATATQPVAEVGTGKKLKIGFDDYGGGAGAAGIRVFYGNVTLTNGDVGTTVGSNQILAYSGDTSWIGTTASWVVDINAAGQLTLTLNGNPIFTNLQLPADYVSSNKSTWGHVFKARTGGLFREHSIDDLSIKYYFNGYLGSGSTYPGTSAIFTTTDFYVSEISEAGCESPRTTVTATVTPADSVAISADDSTVCLGTTVALTANKITSPNNSAYTYTWSATPSAGSGITGTVNGSSLNVTPTAAGTYVYRVVAVDGVLNCTTEATLTVTVNPVPTITSSSVTPTTVCSGEFLTAYAESVFPQNVAVGRISTTTTSGTNLSTYTQVFSLNQSVRLNSIDVISTTGTAITINLYNSDGSTLLFTSGPVVTTPGITNTIPLNWDLTPGTFRINPTAMTGNFIRESSGVAHPFALGTVGTMLGYTTSVTGSVLAGASNPYYFIYNMNVRIPNDLTATYTWNWSDNIGTVLNNNSGIILASNTGLAPVTVNYVAISTIAATGCQDRDTIPVTINPKPDVPTAVVSTESLCGAGVPSVSVKTTGAGFNITNDGASSYVYNSLDNPEFVLQRGVTYTFNINAPGHPFWISTTQGTGNTDAYSTGVSNNGTANGTITFTVPAAGPDTLYYNCEFHGSMSGIIRIAGSTVPVYRWYSANSGGTLLQESTSTTYTSVVSTTTTFYVAAYNGYCESTGRMPLTVTVTPAPTFTITSSSAICSGTTAATELSVLAGQADFTTFTWSPLAGLYNDAAATDPYTGGNATTVYAKNTASGSYTYSCLATGNVGGCQGLATSTVTLLPSSLSISISGDSSFCGISGQVLLSATPGSGFGSSNIQWQSSLNGTTWSDIAGATDSIYNTPLIDSTTFFRAIVRNSAGDICIASNTRRVEVPKVLTTTPGTRCGPGQVSLSASGTLGTTINWYDSPSSNTVLFSGSTYSVNAVASRSYWAAAASAGSITSSAGRPTPDIVRTDYWTNYGLQFDAAQSLTLNSVVVYPSNTSPANMTIRLLNSNGDQVPGTSDVVFTPIAAAGSTPQTVNLDYFIPAGTGYRLLISAGMTFSNQLVEEITGFTYPIVTGPVTITSGRTSSGTTATRYSWFYNWSVTTRCESPRVEVPVTLTTPPSITASGLPSSICPGESAVLNVTSPNAGYSYSWTGNLIGASHTVSPSTSTTYEVTAVDSSGGANSGCNASANVIITVKPKPFNVVATASTDTACVGGFINLSATAKSGEDVAFNFFEGFESATFPPAGWTLINAGSGNNWTRTTSTTYVCTGSGAMYYSYNSTNAANTWMITPAQNLAAGVTYTLSFKTDSYGNTSEPESMRVTVGNGNTVAAQTTQLINLPAITNTTCSTHTVTYTPTVSGDYYFGFNATSPANYWYFGVDDINITGTLTVTPTWSWSSDPTGLLSTLQNVSGVQQSVTTIYTVTATNTVGCSTSASDTVRANDLAVSATVTDALCLGGASGTLTATGTGGKAPYEFSLNGINWQSSNQFTGLVAGSYTVQVRDASNPQCVVLATSASAINEPVTAVALTITGSTDPICRDNTNGTITASATGGTGAIEFSLNGTTYQASGSFTGLASGSYTVYAKDANGCVDTEPVVLNNPALPSVTASNNTSTTTVCSGNDVTLTATAGYTAYSWTGPGVINDNTSVTATAVAPNNGDVFTVTITDNLGCQNSATTTVAITSRDAVSVSISAFPSTEICSGESVTFTATPVNGGSSPVYEWYVNNQLVPAQSGSSITLSTLADQDVVYAKLISSITCTTGSPATSNSETITVSGFIFPTAAISGDNDVCAGDQVTYTVSGTGLGSTPTVEFYVNSVLVQTGLSNTYSYVPVNGDVVSAVATSSFSCALGGPVTTNSISMTVNVIPAAPVITPSGVTEFCNGGSVTLSSSYATGNVWTPGGATTQDLVVTTAGSYTVVHTSAAGCSSPASAPVVVTVNANPTVNITGNNYFCTYQSTTLTADASAGSGNITGYQWTFNDTTALGIGSTEVVSLAGNYTVTVFNSNGCSTTSAALAVSEATLSAAISAPCIFLTPGRHPVLTGLPATGVTYEWSLNGGATLSTDNPYSGAPDATGTYQLVVTNTVTGCKDTATQIIYAASGPIAGGTTFNIPDTACGGFQKLYGAINYLNNNGVTGTGQITFNVAAGHTETAPARGLTLGGTNPATNTGNNAFLASQSSATPIVFQKSGTGANPLVTASVQPAGSLVDAVIRLRGADYITFDGIDVRENPANTDTARLANNMTEFGYAFAYNDTTNGAQNNTIRNSAISLNRTYSNTFGIYSNARHNPDSIPTKQITDTVNGTNSFNKFYANSISNVNYGIIIVGASLSGGMDNGNDIGGSSSETGNTITNWGGFVSGSASSYPSVTSTNTGIQMNHQIGDNVSFNTVTSATNLASTTGQVNGILKNYSASQPTPGITFTTNYNSNTVTLTNVGATTSQMMGIGLQGLTAYPAATFNCNNNNILNLSTSGASISSATILGMLHSSAPGTFNITGNTFRGFTSAATSGGATAIQQQTNGVVNALNINNNKFGDATAGAVTFSAVTSGAVTGFAVTSTGAAATCNVSIRGNDIRGIVHNVTGTSAHTYFSQVSPVANSAVSGNTITNLNVATTGTIQFVNHGYTIPANGISSVDSNSVVTGFTRNAASGSMTLTSTNSASGNGTTQTYRGNNFSNISVRGSASITGLNNTDGGAGSVKTVTNNTLSNWSGGTGAIVGFNMSYWNGASVMSDNLITNITDTGAISGIVIGSSANNATSLIVSNNTISNLNAVATGGNVLGMSCANTSTGIDIRDNTITGLSSTGASSTVTGITISGANAAGTLVRRNLISGLAGTGASAPVVTGLNITGGTLVNADSNVVSNISSNGTAAGALSARAVSVSGGTTVNVRKNKLTDIRANRAFTTAGAVNGIIVSAGTTVNLINNIIGDLRADSANTVDAIRGISVTSTTASSTINVYYNTVRLAASSVNPASVFGTSAVFHTASSTATTAALNMRNNIFVNKSVAQGANALTVAYRRSSRVLTNYASTSNNNLFFTGTPSATNLIFADTAAAVAPANAIQTLSGYQTRVAPRDGSSISEDPTFLSTTAADATYLHIDPTVSTSIEGGAVNITGVTDDFDGNIRQGNAGYTGGSLSGPDIGADEFEGTPPPCSGSNAGTALSNKVTVCSANSVGTFTHSGVSTGLGITYAWKVSTTAGSGYTDVVGGSGANTSAYTTPTGLAAGTYYYVLEVTCSSTSTTSQSGADTLVVVQSPAITVSSNSPVCSGTPLQLTGTTTVGTTYSWSGPNAYTSSLLSPTIASAPLNGSGWYKLTVTSSGCSTTDSTNVTVNLTPGQFAATPASATSCASDSVTISLVASGLSGTIGTGTTSNTTVTPYRGFYGGQKVQILYTAAELNTMGLTSGSTINSVTMRATSFTSPYTFNNFGISMKLTTSTAMTSTFETGMTQVLDPATLTLSGTAPFDISHTLSNGFNWDGTSNLIVEYCFNNNDGGGASGNSVTVQTSSTVGSFVTYTGLDNNATVCTSTSGTTSTAKPNITLGFTRRPTHPVTWSPLTDISVSADGLTARVAPASTTTYVATATNGTCTRAVSVPITVRPKPTATITGTTSKCVGESSPVFTLTGVGGTTPYTFSYRINGGAIQTLTTISTNTSRTLSIPTGTAGTYTYEIVRVADAFCNDTVIGSSAVLTVVAPPKPIITGLASTYCVVGSSVTIGAVDSSGTVYTGGTFTGAGVTDNGDGTATFDPAAAGSGGKVVSFTFNNGTCTGTATAFTTVQAIVSPGTISQSAVCEGNTITLTSTGAATPGTWSSADPLIATIDGSTGAITGVAAGSVDITYTVTSGCGAPQSTTKSITVDPVSNAGDITGASLVCMTYPETFTTDGQTGGTWRSTNTAVATVDASGLVTPVAPGTAQIQYIKVSGVCSADTARKDITVENCITTVSLKAYIQGYYTGGGTMSSALNSSSVPGATATQADSITVELRDGSTGALYGSVKTILNTNGTATAAFPRTYTSYYIVIKHRNSIETWSAAPVTTGAAVNYDFSTSAAQAYGSGQVDMGGGVYAMWSGDLNQDGAIESADYAIMENDVNSIPFGYITSDITGDGVTESADYALIENNIPFIIFAQKPF